MGTQTTVLNLPNLITLGRIALVPVIVLLYSGMGMIEGGAWPHILRYGAFLLYLIATFSDLFDGYYARRRQEVSTFGKMMDPLADKLLALSLMILFSAYGLLPVWYTLVFLWRELAITTLRAIAMDEGVAISASKLGKRKTVYLNIALGFFFLPATIGPAPVHQIAWIFLAIALAYCLASGWQYSYSFYKFMARKERI